MTFFADGLSNQSSAISLMFASDQLRGWFRATAYQPSRDIIRPLGNFSQHLLFGCSLKFLSLVEPKETQLCQ